MFFFVLLDINSSFFVCVGHGKFFLNIVKFLLDMGFWLEKKKFGHGKFLLTRKTFFPWTWDFGWKIFFGT